MLSRMEPKKTMCPFCGSTNVRKYSYEDKEFGSEAEREEYYKTHRAGKIPSTKESPMFHCDECNKDFGAYRE